MSRLVASSLLVRGTPGLTAVTQANLPALTGTSLGDFMVYRTITYAAGTSIAADAIPTGSIFFLENAVATQSVTIGSISVSLASAGNYGDTALVYINSNGRAICFKGVNV